ncbi:MAG: hypothetical protein A2087_03195 [Spirochaetes bacterium GWD1_61_31]|nr:MAG: hypothetical protein A2Y37_12720 [Spirochaetes bacterium GWB1_60_80]OHD32955.1 MAG: hypothetical protein A2004_00985 [Spirochaetes bacterium GWC1_61_12]OHD38694.1 MAG: hypothetical protein A2087_03195 [Spirochaetes bacterium GWD1_61_31]OHD43260.1 MAG: hypothetical protein A2Y35_08235 [Spirochaetes bacterium GWE1_60_18]OHD58820.1 MAG: hypothetical protein A2Y32_01075 [Spirochaetes bacterium GWF1_60_12]
MPRVSVLPHWAEACVALSQADPALRPLLERYAGDRLRGSGSAFTTLANAIVGQQISVKAAASIWSRLRQLLAGAPDAAGFEPAAILAASDAELRVAGLSTRKVEYLRSLSSAFAGGQLQPELWPGMDDDAIIAQLSGLRGIGRWTAEMFLIFHLHRPDVLPLDDIALLRAAGRALAADGQPFTAAALRERAERWRPWRTVATWYLWRLLDQTAVVY